MPAWGRDIDQANFLRTLSVNRTACQHQIECLTSPNQRGHALGTAPARHDADHHFGQRHFCFWPVVHDAVFAGEGKFGASAHAKTVNQRNRRKWQCCHLVEYDVTKRGECKRFLRAFQCGEFIDVGTGREAVFLGRANGEATRLFGQCLQTLADVGEFTQCFARERIGAGPGPIKSQPGEIVGVCFKSPVLPVVHVVLLREIDS